MMNRRKILVPLDGSEFSLRILQVIRTQFEPEEAHLILFRVADPPILTAQRYASDLTTAALPVGGTYQTYSRALDQGHAEAVKERETYRSQLIAELRRIAEPLEREGYAVSVEVVFGEPSQRIMQYIEDAEIDLVAMTTHGRTGLSRALMGSIAERVLRGVSIPVLLIRNTEQADASLGSVEAMTDMQA
jgi:nucleotide-binding universal stress UspA family protein